VIGVKEEVCKNLLYYRKKSKLSQKALADLLGVRHNTVSQWESGKNTIDIDTLHRVCEIFLISINDIFGTYANVAAGEQTPVENRIISDFRSLNEEGKQKFIDYIEDLKCSGRYIKNYKYGVGEEKAQM
jgi:transcriptional regulator with XRE-family HTH domain